VPAGNWLAGALALAVLAKAVFIALWLGEKR
jgi:hypothetical protein